ncbi:hypothetical protein BYT27DRAFT_7037711, partial [Phlegmacium glaucopus]
FYHKIAGKTLMNAGISLNADVSYQRNFKWLINIIPKAIGVHFWLSVKTLNDNEADFELWSDASLHLGLSFVYAGRGFMYAMAPSNTKEKIDIFFLELIAILSAIHHIVIFPSPPQKVLLWTD